MGRGPLLARVALAVVAGSASLWAAPHVLRVMGRAPARLVSVVWSPHSPARWVDDPELIFAARAGHSGTMQHVDIADGSVLGQVDILLGDGGERAPIATSSGGILALGDSLTFGWGVEGDAAWPQITGAALGLPVSNLGFPGYELGQSVRLLERTELATTRAPSLVLLGLYINDLTPSASVRMHQPLPNIPRLPEVWREDKTPALLRWIFDALAGEPQAAEPRAGKPGPRALPRPQGQKERPRLPDLYRADLTTPDRQIWARGWLKRMATRCDEISARCVIVLLPAIQTFQDDTLADALASVGSIAEAEGLGVIDLSSLLDDHTYDQMWLLPEDAHPSSEAHRLIGEATAQRVRLRFSP